MSDQMFPGAEDWAPEDEGGEPDLMENIGNVFRVVDADGKMLVSNNNISGVYTDEEWAKNALTGHKGNRYKRRWHTLPYRVQRARVQWLELED